MNPLRVVKIFLGALFVVLLSVGVSQAQQPQAILYSKGTHVNRAGLYFSHGEERALEIDTWGGHFTISDNCVMAMFTGYDKYYGAFIGLYDTKNNVEVRHFSGAYFNETEIEAFMFPSFRQGSYDYAVVISTPKKRSLLSTPRHSDCV